MLNDADRIVFFCHAHPDGDALGSAFAVSSAMRRAGKRAVCAAADELPARLAFIADRNKLLSMEEAERFCAEAPTLTVAVDVASSSMLGVKQGNFPQKVDIKIDHHATGEDFAEYNLTFSDAAATGEIIYELLADELDITPSRYEATALLAAIVADTGGFRYSNTTPRTHDIAADLIDIGADNYYVTHNLFEKRTRGEVHALSAAYSSLRFFMGGRIAAVVITNQMKSDLDFTDDDLGEVNSLPRELDGVELGLVIKQSTDSPQRFKLSTRSGENVDADTLCAEFGGGGHKRAAGATIIAGSPEEALSKVLAAAERLPFFGRA